MKTPSPRSKRIPLHRDKTPPLSLFGNNCVFSGTAAWNDYTNSSPMEDILSFLSQIECNAGEAKFSCSVDVYKKLIFHPDFIHWNKWGHQLMNQLYEAKTIKNGNNVFLIEGPDKKFLAVPLDQSLFGEPILPCKSK